MNNTMLCPVDFDNFSITRTLTDTPDISPDGGYFQMNQQVALTTSVPDSQIRYTIDGSEPTEASAIYTAPFTIDANRTVKAKLFKAGYNPGPTATAMFNQPGLMVKYYEGSWTTLPDFSTLTPYKVSMIPDMNFPNHYGHMATSGLEDNVGMVISGKFKTPLAATGLYNFYLYSDECSALYVDGIKVINYSPTHAFSYKTSGYLSLAPGFHDIRVEYYEKTDSGGLHLDIYYTGTPRGGAIRLLTADEFYSPDTDFDGLPDEWEMYKFGNLDHSASEDTDNDGFTDVQELNVFFTDPSSRRSIPCESVNPVDAEPQLAVSYCEMTPNRSWIAVPDLRSLPHYMTGNGLASQINYPSSATVNFASSGKTDKIAAMFKGFINITTPGSYRFYLDGDDGSNLYINGQEIVNNDGQHVMGTARETYGMVFLAPGMYDLEVQYYETLSTAGLIMKYEGPGIAKQVVPASVLFHSANYVAEMLVSNDTDSDGLTDAYENSHGTFFNSWDSDGDGISDGDEVSQNLDPATPTLFFYVDGSNGSDSNPGTIALPRKTIQGGIDCWSDDGNEHVICVDARDTYSVYEPGNMNILIDGKNKLKIRSYLAEPEPAGAFCPTINCQGGGRAFTFQNVSASTEIADFMFVNCSALDDGGAIKLVNASTGIRNCVFKNCIAAGNGGAIHVSGGSPEVDLCEISGCRAVSGGAIAAVASDNITVSKTRIFSSSASQSGGAVYADSTSCCLKTALLRKTVLQTGRSMPVRTVQRRRRFPPAQ